MPFQQAPGQAQPGAQTNAVGGQQPMRPVQNRPAGAVVSSAQVCSVASCARESCTANHVPLVVALCQAVCIFNPIFMSNNDSQFATPESALGSSAQVL